MKNLIIIILLATLGIAAAVDNETRIGYVYMDLVMNNMPETQEMQAVLNKFAMEKQTPIDERREALNRKYVEYQKKESTGQLTDAGRIIAQNEMDRLQNELESMAQQNEQELMAKRGELLSPIAKKIETAMDAVAEKYGYKYVLNSADGTGNSIVIVAPDADDLTQEVMTHLGIDLE